MLIIIEGNEGTGKTTLINNLEEHLPFVRLKYSKDVKNIELLLQFAANSEELFVADRSFVTDMVYRIFDGKKGKMSLQSIGTICYSNVKIVMCDNDTGYEDAMKRGEKNITDKKDYDYITNTFYKIIRLLRSFTNIEIFQYDFHYTSVEEVVNFIKED